MMMASSSAQMLLLSGPPKAPVVDPAPEASATAGLKPWFTPVYCPLIAPKTHMHKIFHNMRRNK